MRTEAQGLQHTPAFFCRMHLGTAIQTIPMNDLPDIHLRLGKTIAGPIVFIALRNQVERNKLRKTDELANSNIGPWHKFSNLLREIFANGGWIPDSVGEGSSDNDRVSGGFLDDIDLPSKADNAPRSHQNPVAPATDSVVSHGDESRSREDAVLAKYGFTDPDETRNQTKEPGWAQCNGLTRKQSTVTISQSDE